MSQTAARERGGGTGFRRGLWLPQGRPLRVLPGVRRLVT